MGKRSNSASQMTHNLKVLGNGSMQKGLERLAYESRQAGRQEMLNYFQKLSLIERVFGPFKTKQ